MTPAAFPGPLTIRTFVPDDLEACLGIFDSNVPRYFRPAERDEFTAFLSDLPGPYLVCFDGSGDPVACGGYALRANETVADLCWGMVRRDLHGAGLGRRLLERRLDAVRADARVTTVALETSQLTVGFYEPFGFRTANVTPDGYGPGLDRCEMRLRL